jgi:hypothetical protein
MAYTKNIDPWTSSTPLSTTFLDNFETIYTESAAYLAAHTHDTLYYTKTEMEASFWYAGNSAPGSGSDADLIYKSTGNLHGAGFAGLGVSSGLIILWYGAVGDVPSGWHLCDGNAGTVNLLDRMVVGAGTGSGYSLGDTGGAATFTASGSISVDAHVLTASEMGQHRHPFSDYYRGNSSPNIYGGAPGAVGAYSGTTDSAGSGTGHGHPGTPFTGNAINSMPYYKALCYIQKS